MKSKILANIINGQTLAIALSQILLTIDHGGQKLAYDEVANVNLLCLLCMCICNDRDQGQKVQENIC